MTFHSNRTARCLVALGALALFSACSSSGTSGGGTTAAPTTSVAPITDPATTPPTTIAPTTDVPTTLAPTPSAPFFLRGDGVGPFDFGAMYADVLASMPLGLLSDDPYTFPHPTLFFAFAAGRAVCWDDGGGATLCTYFGGTDPAYVSLVGWRYDAGPGLGLLSSNIGASVNVLVSDVPAMPAIEGACYDYTTVALDGVAMDLTTGTSDWFGNYAADGTFVPTIPIPPASRITSMQAGEQMVSEGVDC